MSHSRRRLIVGCLCLVVSSLLHAQERRAGGPPYDPANEVTVSGTISGTDTFTPPDGVDRTILNITVDGKPLAIIIGPATWFTSQRFTFEKGASVQVTGLTGGRLNSAPAMLPRLVKVGTKTLTVRDPKGVPMWESRRP